MSEQLSNTEQHETHVAPVPTPEVPRTVSPEHKEKLKRHHEAEAAHQAAKAREQIKHSAEAASQPLERLEAVSVDTPPAPQLNINRELKAITLRRELKNIQRKLPAPARALSKVVHQPAVRMTSEIAGKTVSRPSGLLGGSLVAFFGTTAYYFLAKDIGFTYNYLVFLALFVGGFLVGVGLEFIVYLATASHRQAHD